MRTIRKAVKTESLIIVEADKNLLLVGVHFRASSGVSLRQCYHFIIYSNQGAVTGGTAVGATEDF